MAHPIILTVQPTAVALITGKLADFTLYSRGKEYLAAYLLNPRRWNCRRAGDPIQFHELPKRMQRTALSFASGLAKIPGEA